MEKNKKEEVNHIKINNKKTLIFMGTSYGFRVINF